MLCYVADITEKLIREVVVVGNNCYGKHIPSG